MLESPTYKIKPRTMVKSLKCPNCGAPLIVPFMCEYCGSRFETDYDRIGLIEIPIKMDIDGERLARSINPALYVVTPTIPTKERR